MFVVIQGERIMKQIIIKGTLFILLTIIPSCINAQSILGGQDYYDILFNMCVKSCDEFMCRFNEEEFFPDLDKNDEQLGQKNMMLLFDYQLSKGLGKEKFLQDVWKFYDVVKSNNVKLEYESKKWFAEVRVTFMYNKKSIELGLVFQPEKTPKGLDCWTIIGVNGLDKIGYKDSTQRLVVSPEQHEAEFMELESDFKFSAKEFSLFRSYKSKLDALSYFFALVESGVLVFKKRVSTIYHFFDVPSYMFSVTYINRKNSNTGWLITSYEEVNDIKKCEIINKLLCK